MIQKKQRYNSRKLLMHMRLYLTLIRKLSMISMGKKVLRIKRKVNNQEVDSIMTISSSNSLEEEEVPLANKEVAPINISSSNSIKEGINNNNNSNRLKTCFKIVM